MSRTALAWISSVAFVIASRVDADEPPGYAEQFDLIELPRGDDGIRLIAPRIDTHRDARRRTSDDHTRRRPEPLAPRYADKIWEHDKIVRNRCSRTGDQDMKRSRPIRAVAHAARRLYEQVRALLERPLDRRHDRVLYRAPPSRT